MQVAELTAPEAVEYCPAAQSMHPPEDGSPDPDAYAPAKHKPHAAEDVAASAVEYSPAPQSHEHADSSPDADA
jgi:hypothetical protein